MKIIGERLKALRETANLSQQKIADLCGFNQPSIARYEMGKATPSMEILLWYADHFNVSMDYIFGRTDNPQGGLYDYDPRINASSDELRRFIEMCFDPASPVSKKLKSTMFEMFEKGDGKL